MNLTSNDRPKISAFVICCNEEKNIRRCLKSLEWCDEIVVVDSGSSDKTLEICKEFTQTVLHRDWTGHREQKQYALDNCKFDWVLSIDADEEVSPELKNQIIKELTFNYQNQPEPEIKGYSLSRIVYFMSRWWNKGGWYPEFRLRLIYKPATYWGGVDPHDKAIVKGKVKKITEGALYHYTYSDLFHQIECLNQHSTDAANRMHSRGKKVTILNLLINPISRFIKFFLIKKGYREGMYGFIVAINEAWYAFLKYAKLWELQKK